VEDLEE